MLYILAEYLVVLRYFQNSAHQVAVAAPAIMEQALAKVAPTAAVLEQELAKALLRGQGLMQAVLLEITGTLAQVVVAQSLLVVTVSVVHLAQAASVYNLVLLERQPITQVAVVVAQETQAAELAA